MDPARLREILEGAINQIQQFQPSNSGVGRGPGGTNAGNLVSVAPGQTNFPDLSSPNRDFNFPFGGRFPSNGPSESPLQEIASGSRSTLNRPALPPGNSGGFFFNRSNSSPGSTSSSGGSIVGQQIRQGQAVTIGGFSNAPDRSGWPNSSPASASSTGSRRGGDLPSRSALGLQEFRQLCGPYSSSQPAGGRRNANFRSPSSRTANSEPRERLFRIFCLGSPDDKLTPDSSYKSHLEDMGLGEKSVSLSMMPSSSPDPLKQEIRRAFCLLEQVDFELMKAAGGGGPGKRLIRINEFQAIPSVQILLTLPRVLIYIRPVVNIMELNGNEDDDENEFERFQNRTAEFNYSPSGARNGDQTPVTSNLQTSAIEASLVSPNSGAQNILDAQTLQHSTAEPMSIAEGRSFSGSLQVVDPTPATSALQTSANFEFLTKGFATFGDFRDALHSANPGENVIVMQRDNMLQRVIELYAKDATLNLFMKPKVAFVGEQGIDLRGLTKEFFSESQTSVIFQSYLGRHPIFEGEEDHKIPSADPLLLRSGVFKAVGKLMVHGFINTGVAIPGLSKAVKEYLLSPSTEEPCFSMNENDLTNLEARGIVLELQNWTDDNPLPNQDRVRGFLLSQGINADVIWSNKNLIVQSLMLNQIIDLRKGQLDDLRRTIWDNKMGSFLSERPYLWDAAFPNMSDHQYVPSIVLPTLDFIGSGAELERVKDLITAFIGTLDSCHLSKFLKSVTGWPYLTDNRITIDVGPHAQFKISTCFDTVQVPEDMSNTLIQNCLQQAMMTNAFDLS